MLVTASTRDDRVHLGRACKLVKKLWDIAEKNNIGHFITMRTLKEVMVAQQM